MITSRTVPGSVTRGNTVRAVLLVAVGSTGVFTAAAIAMSFFDRLGAIGTSSLRIGLAALLLLAIFRPRLRGRSGREWVGIVLYGLAMASMNSFLYLSFDRLPIGVATTIDFMGPCLVALAASRRPREGLLAIAALVGVGLIAGFGGPFDPMGLIFAALAGASFGMYTLFAARVGQSAGGLPSVALSVMVAAVLTLPFSVPVIPLMQPEFWLPLIASAALGTTLAFTVDTLAGRLTSARVLGVLFAFDPVVGTLIGALVLGQMLTPVALGGIVLVVAAGAGVVWLAGERSERGPVVEVVGGGPYAGGMEQRAVESLEIERKYEVREGSVLPSAAALAAAGFIADATETHELRAAYFDTAGRDLARQRLAVRQRYGGTDAGWHLKEKGPDGTRELVWPPADRMPEELRREIEMRIGAGVEIAAIAELRTTRQVTRLRGTDGLVAVELVDDRVRAVDRVAGVRRAWREWEAELAPAADPGVLDALEPVLTAAGAAPSPSTAKIARATGALEGLALAAGAGEEQLVRLRAMDSADRAAAEQDPGVFDDFEDTGPRLNP